jgi:hypothetical protein
MGLALLVTGIFAGIALSLATLYSVAQAVLMQGRPRLAHAALLVLTLAAMAALHNQSVPLARLFALPLLAAAIWAFALERGWFRVFPLLQQLFAAVLLTGWVAL